MSLEDLEKQLYSFKANQEKLRKGVKNKGNDEPESQLEWQEEKEEETQNKGMSKFLKYILISTGIIILSLIVLGIYFVSNYNPNANNIEIAIIGPKEVYRGAPFEVSVAITNQTQNLLRQVKINLNMPTGLILLDASNSNGFLGETIGDIGDGSSIKKTYRVLGTGEDNSLQKLEVSLSYEIGGKAKFEKNETKEIIIKESAIKMSVKDVGAILSGSSFKINIEYQNISEYDFGETALSMEYPTGFKYISADLNPTSLNNYWRLGEIRSNSKGGLEIVGILETIENNRVSIPITLNANFLGIDYPVAKQNLEITLAPSPLVLQITVNNSNDYIARAGDNLTYTIQYQNKSGIALQDVVIEANLLGEMFDYSLIRTTGNIDSIRNKLIWNVSNTPELKLVDPGTVQEVGFNVVLKNQFPIQRLSDKNFKLKVTAKIDSPSVPAELREAKSTSGTDSLETKISGLTTINTEAYYRDAKSQIINTGILPPKVNTPTTYTIHWVIKNYSTDIKNVEVRGFLKSGVKYTGIVKSNIASVPMYDERSQEMVWKIEKIVATKGIINDPIEATFQIEATPNSTEVGQYKNLIDTTTLRATDDFTGNDIVSSDSGMNTSLPDDKTLDSNSGRVVE